MLVIDAHHHWMPREHVETIRQHLGPGEEAYRDGGLLRVSREGTELFTIDVSGYTSPAEQIREMDAAGVDLAVLSTGLWQWWNSMELAPMINDQLAGYSMTTQIASSASPTYRLWTRRRPLSWSVPPGLGYGASA